MSDTLIQVVYDDNYVGYISGIGLMEPKIAIIKYYEAFEAILDKWSDNGVVVSGAHIEMCNAFNVLRHALDPSSAPPEKLTREGAENLIKTNGLCSALGI